MFRDCDDREGAPGYPSGGEITRITNQTLNAGKKVLAISPHARTRWERLTAVGSTDPPIPTTRPTGNLDAVRDLGQRKAIFMKMRNIRLTQRCWRSGDLRQLRTMARLCPE